MISSPRPIVSSVALPRPAGGRHEVANGRCAKLRLTICVEHACAYVADKRSAHPSPLPRPAGGRRGANGAAAKAAPRDDISPSWPTPIPSASRAAVEPGRGRVRTFFMKNSFAVLGVFLVMVMVLSAVPERGQAQSAAAPDKLLETIRSLDMQLFDAYNRCDLKKFGSLLDENVEFYHDVTGLTRGRDAIVDAVKNNICGKVTRQLVPASLEVYPIAHYGAVEIGVHRFHHPGHEDTEGVGEAKFIHLWQEKDGSWKVTRVISFDHHAAGK